MSAVAGRVLILPKSAYVAGTTYNMLDLVKYNNKTFMAKRTNTNVTPVDGADWMELTDDGVQSFKGRAGVVNPAKGDYDISQISPLNGATVGMVPVVINVGTAQSPVYEFGLSYISGGGIGTCGSIQPMPYAYLVVPNAEFNVASGSYLSVVFSTDFYYDGIHALKLAIGESSYSVKINGQNPEANVIYVRSGDAGIFVYDGTDFQLIGTSGGGHVIVDQDGNELTQEPKMKFLDAFVGDNSTDGVTEIENIKEVDPADYASTTDEGIIVTDDGDDALIGPVSDDYVEVTASGSEQWGAFADRLFAEIDTTKIQKGSYLTIAVSNTISIIPFVRIANGKYCFSHYRLTDANTEDAITMWLSNGSSKYYGLQNGTITDYTTGQPPQGTKLTLYYGNRKATVDLQTTANRCVTSDNKTVQQVFDAMEFTAITGITPGTGISNASMMKASIGGRTLLRGAFKVTSARASGDTIMSGLGILGGGVGVTASPYLSGGMATYLNGALLSNSTLAVSANAYYFFGII